ncbi:MAG: CvpA family protein [Rhodobacteraceae bacterium]|nr:CvpA family protein [Paracoccaceae bacterium]
MQGFTSFDGIVAGIIVISAILAYSRGFIREAMVIAGWVIAAIVAFFLAPLIVPLMRNIPYVGEFIGDSTELGIILAFATVFAVALTVLSLSARFFSLAVRQSALSGIDAGLGALFGIVRGVLLIVVALIVYDRAAGDHGVRMINDSRTARIFAQLQDRIEAQIPTDAPIWILNRYEELMNAVKDEPAAPADAPGDS